MTMLSETANHHDPQRTKHHRGHAEAQADRGAPSQDHGEAGPGPGERRPDHRRSRPGDGKGEDGVQEEAHGGDRGHGEHERDHDRPVHYMEGLPAQHVGLQIEHGEPDPHRREHLDQGKPPVGDQQLHPVEQHHQGAGAKQRAERTAAGTGSAGEPPAPRPHRHCRGRRGSASRPWLAGRPGAAGAPGHWFPAAGDRQIHRRQRARPPAVPVHSRLWPLRALREQ